MYKYHKIVDYLSTILLIRKATSFNFFKHLHLITQYTIILNITLYIYAQVCINYKLVLSLLNIHWNVKYIFTEGYQTLYFW